MLTDELPEPSKPWNQLPKIKASRLKAVRALFRKREEPKKFRALARWVRSIRKGMKKSKGRFAVILGVSVLTVRRWENQHGRMPSPKNMKRLESLERTLKRLKEEGLEFE